MARQTPPACTKDELATCERLCPAVFYQLNYFKAVESDLQKELQATIDEREKKVKDAKTAHQQYESLQKDHDSLYRKYKSLYKQYTQESDLQKSLQDVLEGYKRALEKLQSQNSSLWQARCAELEAEFSRMKQAMDENHRRLQQLQVENTSLAQQRNEAWSVMEKMRRENERAERECAFKNTRSADSALPAGKESEGGVKSYLCHWIGYSDRSTSKTTKHGELDARAEDLRKREQEVENMHQQLASEFKKRTGARNIEAIQTTFTAFFQHDVPSSAKAVFQQKDEWEAEEVLCELFQKVYGLLKKKVLQTIQETLNLMFCDDPHANDASLNDIERRRDAKGGYSSLLAACGFGNPSSSALLLKDIESQISEEIKESPYIHPDHRYQAELYVKKALNLAWSLVTESPPMISSCSVKSYNDDLHDPYGSTTDLTAESKVKYRRPVLFSSFYTTDEACVRGLVRGIATTD